MLNHFKYFTVALALLFAFSNPVSATENTAPPPPTPTQFTVLTDMTVPPECLQNGKTVCAQLAAHAERKLYYGASCFILKNKTNDMLFIPLRSDDEIQQFLLKMPADKMTRASCNVGGAGN